MSIATLILITCTMGECHEFGVQTWEGDNSAQECIARLDDYPVGVAHCYIGD